MGALSWPEEALRANIIAQVSLALNRIWTEWYPSRGYSFNITGSPGYDQAYVNGRTVFAVMERLTAELFNTFVQRSGDAEPYFTEYCDGKTVTCPGMKQWGTVDRAREGMNALQILRYYYGNRVQLVTTDNIAAISSSYPGSPLRRGSTGTNVRILQKQLSRIAKDYPSFGKPAVTGTFDEATENSVKKFQKQFSLTADGVVGRPTWNKVSFIYVSVKDLAELTSEGETAEGTQSTGGWPGTVLRRGSTGSSVEQVQFWLSDLAQFDSSLVRVTVDGSYGAATERAVRAFQQKQSLTADGVVGQRTWNALYAAWVDAQSDLGGTAWPGTALRRGAAGMEVQWTDNKGASGSVDYLSQFHTQDYYYPAWVEADSYTLRGTCLKANNYDQSGNGSYWVNPAYDWGYADNFSPIDRLTDDPNSGAGVNANHFRISDAVTFDGKPAGLKYIDFVKVQTGIQAKSGWLGEISTEVFGVFDYNMTKKK